MKFNKKIPVDMQAFIKSCQFDCLELGQSQAWVLSNFPDPEHIMNDLSCALNIFSYGNIELHIQDFKLKGIMTDKLQMDGCLDGGQFLTLNKWIFKDTHALTLGFVMQAITELQIDFKKETRTYHSQKFDILLILENGIELLFSHSDMDNQNLWLLDCFQYFS